MNENPWMWVLAFPGLLLALGSAGCIVVFGLSLLDVTVASYIHLFRKGRFADIDAHPGLFLPLASWKKRLHAESWRQFILRVWLLGLAFTVAAGLYLVVAGGIASFVSE